MTNVIAFTIPGKPVPKARPRVVNRHAYTPKKTKDRADLIKQIAAPLFDKPFTGPVCVDVIAVFPIPKSWSKKKKAEMRGMPHTQRPDKDNLEKLPYDALNGIAYVDDSQIVLGGEFVKMWGDEAKTIVRVREVTREMWLEKVHGLVEIEFRGEIT